MPDVLQGLVHSPPIEQPPVVVGYVSRSRPAPESFDDPVFVLVTNHSAEHVYGPLDWPAIHGQTMPGQGSAMWLAFDDNGTPIVLTWEGPQGVESPTQGPPGVPGSLAVTDPLTIPGRIAFGSQGVVWADSATVDNASAGTSVTRFRSDLTTANGINVRTSGAADSITSDASNAAGSSFFLNDFRSITHRTKGSAQIYTAVGIISDSLDGGSPKYRELGILEMQMQADSAGAYTALSEGISIVTAGKPSRANGHVVLIDDANARSAYAATVGASSIYADTGARAFAAENIGSATGGTAYHAYGDFERALLCTFFDQADFILESRAQNQAHPYLTLNGLGTFAWGLPTSAPDLNLYRAAAGVLRTDQGFQTGSTLGVGTDATISGTLDVVGTADLQGAVNLGATLGVSGGALIVGNTTLQAAFAHTGTLFGAFGKTPTTQPAHPVTLADVIAALTVLGLTA